MSPAVPLCFLLATSFAAAAQDVQRCETAERKVIYVNGPCPAGTTSIRTLAPTAAPGTEEQKAARQRAQQDVQKAAAIERSRKADDAAAARAQEQARARAAKKEAHCRRLETRLRHAQEDLAGATLKKQTEAQRRVKRAEELYAQDCGPGKG